MKINQIIRNRRKEMELTQEQAAEYLGVTASAVHKWEKGSAYPDITILPALARLLRVDLNTLLSFREELTDKEITAMVQRVVSAIDREGYQAGFELAVECLQEYPGCDELLLQIASTLDGAKIMYPAENQEYYEEKILSFYKRLENSANQVIREQAATMLFYSCLSKGDYTEAEEILGRISRMNSIRSAMEAILLERQGRMQEARSVMERRLLESAGNIQSALAFLQSAALKEEDWELAEALADVNKDFIRTLGLWEYGSYSAYLELHMQRRDVQGCLDTLRGMQSSLKKPWKAQECFLYRDVPSGEEESVLQKRMRSMLAELVREEEKLNFFRESPEGELFLKECGQTL